MSENKYDAQQKLVNISLKSLEVDFETNPNGDPLITRQLLDDFGGTSLLTLFEEAPKINIDLVHLEKEATQHLSLNNSEWDLLNPLESGISVKDSNDRLFDFMRIVNKNNNHEIWIAYELVEYAPYALAPVGEYFLLNHKIVSQILTLNLKLEFQHLSQFEGEYLDINVAPNTSLY
ncbi:hypothetical protein N568_0100970 [Lactococcus garvieae TRF1]|uniref:Uncharacterized protein n=2 Tax=Lactococcus garvieae TRF1 TaxID=1380772 RepID=V8AS58_9LACT|nr:hypothetical protein N568_0100970 [Lactococcus garvieae TRF1]